MSEWQIKSYGPGKQQVLLNGEEVPVTELDLRVKASELAKMRIQFYPRTMDADMRAALVQALPSYEYEQYTHHGAEVWVDAALRGLHRAYCLCHRCAEFKPDSEGNCPKAERLYELCVGEDMVTPVWECPEFQRR